MPGSEPSSPKFRVGFHEHVKLDLSLEEQVEVYQTEKEEENYG